MVRTVYVGQYATIDTNGTTYWVPVSSTSCETTLPHDAVLAFGRLGALANVQNNFTQCKSTLKCYLGTGTNAVKEVNANLINSVIDDAVNGRMSVISVKPAGFIMSGIVSNISLDMDMGGFGTADFTFQGVGQSSYQSALTNTTQPQSLAPPSVVTCHYDKCIWFYYFWLSKIF